MSARPCVFFNKPSGCRRGDQCRFKHDSDDTSQRSSSPPSRGWSSPGPPRGGTPTAQASPSRAPSGICDFYWKYGTCKREFACRFKHTTPSSANTATASTPKPSHTFAIDAIAPYLTEEGLARVTGTGTDVFFSSDSNKDLSPTEAHNALKRFLYNDYRFRMPFDIYSFLKPLSSAHTGNPSWVSLSLLYTARTSNLTSFQSSEEGQVRVIIHI